MSITPLNGDVLKKAYDTLNRAFVSLSANSSRPPAHTDYGDILQITAQRLQDNYPYHHPNYAGHMLKPPHPLAQLAYTLAQSINPNNHALDGGRASSAMEKEAVAHIAQMLGFTSGHLGHLCSGGTIANLEALWVAREQTAPGARILSSEFSHYTHSRLSSLLGVEHTSVPADKCGRIRIDALRAELEKGGVGTVVATLGTTAFGSVDPLAELVELRERYGFRLHVDAAYGGYFRLLDELPCAKDFAALAQADSVVIDPHKLGLQPYGCGCVVFANPADGTVYAHDSPYTYFTSDDLHLGEISLECSRPGASAVALWATQQLLPNTPGGEFASSLSLCRETALEFHRWLDGAQYWWPIMAPDLDVVVWAFDAESYSEVSALSQRMFEALAARDIHIALVKVPAEFAKATRPELIADADTLTCLRVCLMKPEHNAWLEHFKAVLDDLALLHERSATNEA